MDTQERLQELTEELRALRIANGKTTRQVAGDLHMSLRTLHDIEVDASDFKVSTLLRLLNYYGKDLRIIKKR